MVFTDYQPSPEYPNSPYAQRVNENVPLKWNIQEILSTKNVLWLLTWNLQKNCLPSLTSVQAHILIETRDLSWQLLRHQWLSSWQPMVSAVVKKLAPWQLSGIIDYISQSVSSVTHSFADPTRQSNKDSANPSIYPPIHQLSNHYPLLFLFPWKWCQRHWVHSAGDRLFTDFFCHSVFINGIHKRPNQPPDYKWSLGSDVAEWNFVRIYDIYGTGVIRQGHATSLWTHKKILPHYRPSLLRILHKKRFLYKGNCMKC